ncbi:unnamed protein product [Citrullus colocynthis]|uniref:R3H-associated N-terminal domain-containing protein n=1 Tax=Citrullus colocynthis TaxID=252529 RepID=A0ABP0XPC3_9ROSI
MGTFVISRIGLGGGVRRRKTSSLKCHLQQNILPNLILRSALFLPSSQSLGFDFTLLFRSRSPLSSSFADSPLSVCSSTSNHPPNKIFSPIRRKKARPGFQSDSLFSSPIMASTDVLKREADRFTFSPLNDPLNGDTDSRGMSIEKKIEFLESLTGKVTNRKSRRWLNDRLLMELVPRLNAEEIRGLFAPPPWGDDVRPTTFSMIDAGDWDKFRSIDMDKEAKIIGVFENSSAKRKGHIDADKMAFLNAWRRIECRTREALRRSFLPELVEGFEECIRSFISETGKEDVLTLRVQDPFHRLLLHGVCEFYNLDSVTVPESKNGGSIKMTRITRKKKSMTKVPNITLTHFLKMSKEGTW